MHWLQPAIAFCMLASAVLAATFFYTWHQLIRRRYVLLWALAWTTAVPHLALSWLSLESSSAFLWSAQQLTLIANALLMVAGCQDLVLGRLPRRTLGLLAAAAASWALIGPLVTDNATQMLLPASALLAGSYLWTASSFLRLGRERGTRGAKLVAGLFAVAGLHELDYPWLAKLSWGAPAGYALAASLAISISLCLLIMILEESRADVERARSRIQAILDQLPVGVLVVSPGRELLLANRRVNELLSQPADPPNPALQAYRLREPALGNEAGRQVDLAELLDGTPGTSRELEALSPDGVPRPVLVEVAPIVAEPNAEPVRVIAIQDIAALKRMQEEIERTQRLRALGDLSAGVAHDFNNALTMILGHAEHASSTCRDPEVRQELDTIVQVACDGAEIVRRLQELARTRKGRTTSLLDLGAVLREVVKISRPRWRDQAEAAGLRYEVKTEVEDGVQIRGSAVDLREALLNLVLNALDAMPRGGALTLRLTSDGQRAQVRIEDTGMGMTAQVRARIFDPFFTTKGLGGSGLGLPLVLGIVERHEGRIEVASTPGQGTSFTLCFPVAKGEPEIDRPRPGASASSRLAVLAVDDETSVLELVSAILRRAGHEVQIAAGGREAVEALGAKRFDVVVTDLGMPGINGWEVARVAHERDPSTRVVLVTGWGETISSEDAAAAGISEVIGKPFTAKGLTACLARLAESEVSSLRS